MNEQDNSKEEGNVFTEKYSGEEQRSPEKKPDKRRSLLQAPKVYSSKVINPEIQVPKTQPIPIPQSDTSPTQSAAPETCQVETQEFFIGDRVRIAGVKTGTLLYFGTTHIAGGLWCGIALDESDGIHDGLTNGVRYFTCRKSHGIFAPVDKVKHVDIKKVLSPCVDSTIVTQSSAYSKLCLGEVEEYVYLERSCDSELIDELESDGQVVDSEDRDFRDQGNNNGELIRRRVPKLNRGSHGVSRLPFKRRDLSELSRMADNVVDGAVEKLRMIAEVEGDSATGDKGEELNRTFNVNDEKFTSPEIPHSAGGSSGGGDDSWSLSSKDYMTGDCKHYLNITFDENTESKASTQDASEEEESPSPEFIFDQEMIEDGDFCSHPVQMSRDSSLGLLSSYALDKTDLLYDLVDEGEEEGNTTAPSAPPTDIACIPVEKDFTPSKLEQVNFSQVVCSTPATNQKAPRESLSGKLDETFNIEEKKSEDIDGEAALNGTFTLEARLPEEVLALKSEIPDKGPMVDSGISMKSSMTESGISVSIQSAMVDSSVSMKGSLMESTVSVSNNQTSMLDSGISMKSSVMTGSADMLEKNGQEVEMEENGDIHSWINNSETEVISRKAPGMDDQKLMTDLQDGRNKRERPVSFISTTSADTGYVPDTDSELGTLTLNSPQEWMERVGLHSNTDCQEMAPPPRTILNDLAGKIPPPLVESDSDMGIMTGDTDTEVDRPEVVMPVQPGETTLSGVDLTDIVSDSESEVTEREMTADISSKVLNTTQTLVVAEDGNDDVDSSKPDLDSTFTTETDANTVPMVTVVIEDQNDETAEAEEEKSDQSIESNKEKADKMKSPKKKKFNVVKDFKKPNINVVSKLADYIKTPLPVKPKEDKLNTEEAKNKRNTMKGKVEPKPSLVSPVEKKEKEVVVKEPVKKVKRTPPKSKWGAIMSQIDTKKDTEKPKVKEVKSKLECYLNIPPPAPVKKEEPKPKKRISNVIPDYSKVQSKLASSIPAAVPRPRKEESPKRGGKKDASPSRTRNMSQDSSRQRNRNVSGDSVKKHEIRDKALHIDLAESLDGRGSRAGSGSAVSSVRSSHTDLSGIAGDDESGSVNKTTHRKSLLTSRSLSLQSERRDSTSAVSEMSDNSQVITKETATTQNKVAPRGRSSGICPPASSPARLARGPAIVKPVLRQNSAPPSLKPSKTKNNNRSVFARQASAEKPAVKRSRNQNRNKTNKSKDKGRVSVKTEEVIPGIPHEVHTKEVHRLEALCETRTKQLNMVKLQLQTSNQAFDGMSVMVNYLTNDLDAFSCPRLVEQLQSLQDEKSQFQETIQKLEGETSTLESEISTVKTQTEQDLEKLRTDHSEALTSQQQTLQAQQQEQTTTNQESHNRELKILKSSHESKLQAQRADHDAAVRTLKSQHQEEIQGLQTKQENQMEELHKQHQDKLEDITNRFDGIKMTLSEKVESLRSECDQLRNRAKLCEEALLRDSDYKVQLALMPYKNLPQEIESLKTVLEMRNEEIQKLRNQNLDLQKQLEQLPIAEEKIISLQQKKENLEAIISMKTEHEKTLHEKCQNLMKKYDKESRANKRLSMDYEELMWKLSESFNETEEEGGMGSQEALFYQKLGLSPTQGLESPDLGRKFRTPSSSDLRGSPSKSPAYRRSTSSSGEETDRRLKRRSGNFLLDDRKRATSPLAKQNPLTRSWSPGSGSPTAVTSSPVPNKMSQSWNEDVFDSPSITEENIQPVKRRGGRRELQDVNGKARSVLSARLKEDNGTSTGQTDTESRVNGTTADTELTEDQSAVTESEQVVSRSGRETVTLTEGEIVLVHNDKANAVENNGECNSLHDTTNSNSSSDGKNISSAEVLTTDPVSSPPSSLPSDTVCVSSLPSQSPVSSKIPVKGAVPSPDSPGRAQRTKQTTHSLRESAV